MCVCIVGLCACECVCARVCVCVSMRVCVATASTTHRMLVVSDHGDSTCEYCPCSPKTHTQHRVPASAVSRASSAQCIFLGFPPRMSCLVVVGWW
jgi:hypothetical protein